MASWLLTQHTKAKKKEEQEENKDDHVDHQHLSDPRQHRKSSFSATNVSERTTSSSAQLQLSNLHRIHPWWVFNLNLDNLALQVQLRLVSTRVQPRRCSSVCRTSWTALARETARLASATLYQAFVRARMWSLLRQNLGKYLTLNPNWRLRKIFTWGVTFSHALDPSWVRSDLNKKKKPFFKSVFFRSS